MRSGMMAKQKSAWQRLARFSPTITCFGALLISSPAYPRSQMVVYAGENAVSEGHGGTKINAYGVDFWTKGDPPRRFLALAMLTDERGKGLNAGSAVGAQSVADQVRQAGGDAVIIIGRGDVDDRRMVAGGDANFGSGGSVSGGSTITKMTVVKYLGPCRANRDDPRLAAPDQSKSLPHRPH